MIGLIKVFYSILFYSILFYKCNVFQMYTVCLYLERKSGTHAKNLERKSGTDSRNLERKCNVFQVYMHVNTTVKAAS